MTGSDILTTVKSDMDWSETGPVTDTQLLAIMNLIYFDFCRYTRCAEKIASISCPAMVPQVDVPADLIEGREAQWDGNEIYPAAEQALDYDQSDWIFRIGTPERFVFENWPRLRLTPIPDTTGTMKLRYAYLPPALTLTESPVFTTPYHCAMCYGTDAMMYLMLKDFTNFAEASGTYSEMRAHCKAHVQQGQRSPDTLTAFRPLSIFNFQDWDPLYRVRRPF